jgi:hypothetical protein
MQANIELRRLLGIGATVRTDDDDMGRLSDQELLNTLAGEREKRDKKGRLVVDQNGKPVMVRYQQIRHAADIPPDVLADLPPD